VRIASLGASLLLLLAAAPLRAQTFTEPPLADFVGTYEESPGHTLELVAGDVLVAVLDDAKYPLRRVRGDLFLNAPGDTITFPRGTNGRVIGYVERGTLHRRLSTHVSPKSVALLHQRPAGFDSPAAYRYRPPTDRHDGIAVGDIADSPLGVETAEQVVRGVLDGTWADVHGVLLYHRGRLVLEEYFYGYDVDRPHQLRSATKSVVSALAGIAIDRGALSGVREPVLARLGVTDVANPDSRKSRITLEDLLTMRSGLACDDHDATSPGNESRIYETADWVRAAVDLPTIADPGSVGHYCSVGVALVGRMVERAVGESLPDFAEASLFAPLGIRRADWQWNYELTSANREFSQIHLRPRDMLKLGIVYADSGRWHGRQVLPTRWVATSLAAHSRVDNADYGYFWWKLAMRVETPGGERIVPYAAAQGNGGQKICIFPQYDLVVVFTGGAYNVSSPMNRIMAQAILPPLVAQ
jgi:CubicO group peptidase (beta-lactamase class C family)